MKARILTDATPTISKRSVEVTIGEKTYDMILTSAATLAITEKFGGLAELGKAMAGNGDADAIKNTLWLVTLLCNQSVAIHNLWHPESPEPKLTEEAVMLLTTPEDFKEFAEKVTIAITKGARSEDGNEKTEESEKNTQAG